MKVEKITLLKKALFIQNLERDKRKIQRIRHRDISAIQNYLDSSDSSDDDNCNEGRPQINVHRKHAGNNNDVLVVTRNGEEVCDTVTMQDIDPEFSRDYGFTTDVSL